MMPHKPGLDIIIGIGKPKGGLPPRPGAPAGAGDPDKDLEANGQKADPEEAQVFHIAQNCGACDNFQPETGSCKVVDGQYSPDTGCIKYFEPKGSEAAEGEQPSPSPAGGPPAGV